MNYSSQQLADKLAIQELVYDYSDAIDSKQFDRLDDVFLPDALIDYTAFGGPRGAYPEIKKFLEKSLPNFPAYYHLNANVRIQLHGDTATGRVMCFNPMVVTLADGSSQVMFLGLFYNDKYVRTANGWRFQERVEERTWEHNVPSSVNTGSQAG